MARFAAIMLGASWLLVTVAACSAETRDITSLTGNPISSNAVISDKDEAAFSNGESFVSKSLQAITLTQKNRLLWSESSIKGIRQIPGAAELYAKCVAGVVLLVSPDHTSLGAGSVISSSGEIITNWHVVDGDNKMLVFFYDKSVTDAKDIRLDKGATATVVSLDQSKDLALLQLAAKAVPEILQLGQDAELSVAQDVFAIGHPESYIWSFTYGVISGLRNSFEWSYNSNKKFVADIIQSQTPINPGNSGGPLFNDKGQLVGINSFGAPDAQGLNFAVRVREVERFVKEARLGLHKPKTTLKASATKRATISWQAYDSDGNGTADYWGADLNNDGHEETFKADMDKNGAIDVILLDLNGDGTLDASIDDRDGDGSFEYWEIDSDFDGTVDTDAIDLDKDGTPDKFWTHQG